MIKKITVLLTTIGLMVIPLTGCNSNVKVFGKDAVTIEEPDDREFNKIVPNDNQEATYTEEDAIEALVQGEYNVNYKGEDFSFDVAELLNLVFPNSNIYTKKITDTVFQVKIDNGTDYVVFEVNFIDESINEIINIDTGALINKGAYKDLIKKLEKVKDDKVVADKYAINGYNFIKNKYDNTFFI